MFRRHPIEFLAAALLSLAAVLVSIRFWQADLTVPFEYRWDSLYFQAQVKGILENGTIFTNPGLGAPFHSQIHDFAAGDALTLPLTLVLGLFTSDSALAMNLVWLATFPLAAITAWWAMRTLGVGGLPATVAAVLFAILPYHYWRGESHLMLSVYYTIPLAGLLILKVLIGQPLFDLKQARAGTPGARAGLATFLVCVFLIGISGAYYTLFSVIILTLACVLCLLIPERRRAAVTGLFAVAGMLCVLLITLLPSLAFRAEHGQNPEVAQRTVRESEWYGLSLTQMLLPATNHRVGPAAELKARYLDETITAPNDAQSLGVAGAIGLLWVLIAAIISAVAKPVYVRHQEQAAGAATLISILISTVGGGSVVIALLMTTQIRAWSRMSVLIGFFALVGFAFLLERVLGHIKHWPAGNYMAFGFGALLLLFAIYDQTPARWELQFRHAELARIYEADERFVADVEGQFPKGAKVFQSPHLNFPEGYPPPGNMGDYDPLRGYLHSRNLKWSYGAMKGRAADIGACLDDLSQPQLLRAIAGMGFEAIWIDRNGYEPGEFARRIAQTRQLTNSRGLSSEDGRFHVFALDEVEVDPRARAILERAMPTDGDALQDCDPLRKAIASV